jgi:hypothetical protein
MPALVIPETQLINFDPSSKVVNGGSPTHKGRRLDASPTRNGLIRQDKVSSEDLVDTETG